MVSGYGDGALIDLYRLTIERFRQDTILYELFEERLEAIEDHFRALLGDDYGRSGKNVYELIERDLSPEGRAIMERARGRLLARLRKDTAVVLHARGRGDPLASLRDLFDDHSSFLNRVLLYLLYRCGAFTLALGELDDAKREHGVPDEHVVRRYGPATLDAISGLFSDVAVVGGRLAVMADARDQPATRRWPLGAFPHHLPEVHA